MSNTEAFFTKWEQLLTAIKTEAVDFILTAWNAGPTVCVAILIGIWLIANFTQNVIELLKTLCGLWWALWRMVIGFFAGIKLLFVGGTQAVVDSYKEHKSIVEEKASDATAEEELEASESDVDPFDIINEAFSVENSERR